MKRLLAIGLALGLGGCASPAVKLSSEPPADIDRAHGRPITASECGYQLIQLIPIGTNGRQLTA
jgi:hypothetical protein